MTAFVVFRCRRETETVKGRENLGNKPRYNNRKQGCVQSRTGRGGELERHREN